MGRCFLGLKSGAVIQEGMRWPEQRSNKVIKIVHDFSAVYKKSGRAVRLEKSGAG